MKNRTLSSLGLRLGSVLLGLIAGAAGANLYVAGDAAPECTSCHEQGQNWPRARTQGLG
jgi:hypothetical protein